MKVINKQFGREYEALSSYEAGIELTGGEVKSIRAGRIRLDEAFVKMYDNGSAMLVNAEIPRYEYDHTKNYDPKRTRRLLLHKKELLTLQIKTKQGGVTIAPVSVYFKGRLIKVEIALARGRKDVEKRKLDKSKEVKRAQQRTAKEYMKR